MIKLSINDNQMYILDLDEEYKCVIMRAARYRKDSSF